jgi:MerR family copper efflux transcriptional regulator
MIVEAARSSGLAAKTIRYYEEIGLLPPPRRGENGYRDYSERDIRLLKFVRRARELGFDMSECRELVELFTNPQRASRAVKKLALAKIEAIDARIREFRQAKRELQELTAACRGDDSPECAILDALEDGKLQRSATAKARGH